MKCTTSLNCIGLCHSLSLSLSLHLNIHMYMCMFFTNIYARNYCIAMFMLYIIIYTEIHKQSVLKALRAPTRRTTSDPPSNYPCMGGPRPRVRGPSGVSVCSSVNPLQEHEDTGDEIFRLLDEETDEHVKQNVHQTEFHWTAALTGCRI